MLLCLWILFVCVYECFENNYYCIKFHETWWKVTKQFLKKIIKRRQGFEANIKNIVLKFLSTYSCSFFNPMSPSVLIVMSLGLLKWKYFYKHFNYY